MSVEGQMYLLEKVSVAVDYCAMEYDMTWAEAIGVLQMSIVYYANRAYENSEEGDDEDDSEQ